MVLNCYTLCDSLKILDIKLLFSSWHVSLINKPNKTKIDNRGFTLIEVIAVLIILGIMAAVSISRVGSNQSNLIAQADIVKTHLRFAQLKALQDDVNTWSIAFTANSYSLVCTGTNCPSSPIHLPSESSNIHGFPDDMVVASNPSTITYDSWGSPVPEGSVPKVTLSQSGSKPMVITVSANTGYINHEDEKK